AQGVVEENAGFGRRGLAPDVELRGEAQREDGLRLFVLREVSRFLRLREQRRRLQAERGERILALGARLHVDAPAAQGLDRQSQAFRVPLDLRPAMDAERLVDLEREVPEAVARLDSDAAEGAAVHRDLEGLPGAGRRPGD